MIRRPYMIYAVASGKVLRRVLTRNPKSQCREGEDYVAGNVDDRFFRVRDGVLEEIPGEREKHAAKREVQAEKYLAKQARRLLKLARLRELYDSAPNVVQILIDLELERTE